MRLHPRTRIVQHAEEAISEAIHKVWAEADLTDIEVCQILVTQLASIQKYMLRNERHPDDPDKGGDEA
jgi:hypothetical protein